MLMSVGVVIVESRIGYPENFKKKWGNLNGRKKMEEIR